MLHALIIRSLPVRIRPATEMLRSTPTAQTAIAPHVNNTQKLLSSGVKMSSELEFSLRFLGEAVEFAVLLGVALALTEAALNKRKN